MKALIRRPFLSGLLLSLPLWAFLKNYIVALSLALLFSFLITMLGSLRKLKDTSDPSRRRQPPSSTD